MSKWSLVGAWVVIAVIASTLTWQIVSAADAQVSDEPVALQIDPPILASVSSTAIGPGPTTSDTTGETPGSTLPASGSVTSVPSDSSSSAAGPSASTTVSSSDTSANWSVKTIQTGGGVLVVSYRPGEVVLASASPGPGFATEVKKSGPPDVEVEFESESAKYEVKAKWSNGQLVVDTDQESEEGED